MRTLLGKSEQDKLPGGIIYVTGKMLQDSIVHLFYEHVSDLEMPIPWGNTKDQTSAIEGCI